MKRILVTGATGYIGGRLVPRLLDAGYAVRVFVRDPSRILGRAWADRVEVITGDLHDADSVHTALRDCDAAYYLVHSMHAGPDFAERDRRAATIFLSALEPRTRVIYLGGLLPQSEHISSHLSSRAEVGEILGRHGNTLEVRAGPIIGSGSASFEMVRYLTERLPAMITPRWVMNPVQPISIRDILSYLLQALDREVTGVMDVGAEPVLFRQMMLDYAKERGLKRYIQPVPVFMPRLAARWVGLITPIPNRLAIPLVEGIQEPLIGDTSKATAWFPDIHPMSYREAVHSTLARIADGDIESRWSGALGGGPTYSLTEKEGLVREIRSASVKASPQQVFDTFCSLGGDRGWLVWNWAWRLRGALDRMVGGPGLRRGRRHPTQLYPGEAVDFWRVEEVKPGSLLRLRAEMKLPGRAWLQFEAIPEEDGCRIVQTALFAPIGLGGAFYWYGLYPLHRWIFSDMITAVAKLAEGKG